MGMSMRVNPYSPVYMGDPMELFLCRGYEYVVVISGGYLPIDILIACTCGLGEIGYAGRVGPLRW
jgi:hypothetical protein